MWFFFFHSLNIFCVRSDQNVFECQYQCCNGGRYFLAWKKPSFFIKKVIWWMMMKARPSDTSSAPLFVSAVSGNWPLYLQPSSHAARLLSSLKGKPRAQSCFRLLPYVCKAQSWAANRLPSYPLISYPKIGHVGRCVWQRPSLPPAGAVHSHSISSPILDA